jgi:hypothetical protein
VGIFRDQLLVPVDLNYDIIVDPVDITSIWDLQVANGSTLPTAIVGMTPLDSFSTEIGMNQRMAVSPLTQPQFSFPFDLVGSKTMDKGVCVTQMFQSGPALSLLSQITMQNLLP